MIETQKNCKARNSNKSTKESVKPEVSFQVSGSSWRRATEAHETEETPARHTPAIHKTTKH